MADDEYKIEVKRVLKNIIELSIINKTWKNERELKHFINNVIQGHMQHFEDYEHH